MATDPISEVAERWQAITAAAGTLHAGVAADHAAALSADRAERTRHESETQRLVRIGRETLQALKRARDEAIQSARQDHALGAELEAHAREGEASDITRRASNTVREARERLQQALWLAESSFEAIQNGPKVAFEQLEQRVTEQLATLEAILEEAAFQTRRFRQRVPEGAVAPDLQGMAPAMALATQVALASDATLRLRRLRIPGLFKGPILLVPAIFLATGGAATAFGMGARGAMLGVGAGAGVVLTALVATALWFVAKGQVRKAWAPLLQAASTGRAGAEQALATALAQRRRDEQAARERLRVEREAAHAKYDPVIQSVASIQSERIGEVNQRTSGRVAELERECAARVAEAEATFAAASARLKADHEASVTAERRRHAAAVRELADAAARAREDRASAWCRARDAFADWAAARQRAGEAGREIAPPAAGPSSFPEGLRVGGVVLDLASVPHGRPADPALAWPVEPRWEIPLLRPLPRAASTVVEVPADRRAEGLAAIQDMALRLLALSPAGKVRLTLIDPVGLGQSFAGFMHLADEMEQLVGERIWTEPRQIEQRLTDITEHMETVIQKYLRDEYATVAEYNEQAGQLAEPLRVIVMADFPAGLNESAVRRLQSILQSGQRCGVHLLLLRDVARAWPPGLVEEDVIRTCRRLRWTAGGFRVDEAALAEVPVLAGMPPAPGRLQEILRAVGQAARGASVVQVPFEAIVPEAGAIWSGSTAASLRVPIGRTGATQLQQLVLGEGTRQHVLLAGKTGSGKSTLLNAMIVNLASWFSPDELELWLIDFKKGVEFKAYAAHGLPHARAVAVESDREFGLSVLQGLDAELKRRGDLFREAGVQDLPAWRRQGRPEPMPRALLIVDEFQELFVEEDKVAQESALLLDRLVRQGRAFGMHVILGSQTLGGSYALPRATMGQMGVRIALQCNEADAALILSDDNTAARLLSRPGEAIYNDAGGLVEGNSPFQVVWLGDHEREQRIRALAERGRETASRRPPMVVFDGTSRVQLAGCRTLRERIRSGVPQAALPLHLGEPVAIREATVATLRRQSGANLLVIGQSDRMALGISLAVLASVRAAAGRGAEAVVLDGTPSDAPEAGQLAAACDALGLSATVPGYREADDAIRALGERVAQRLESGRTDEPAVVLLVHGLQRFRSLRRDEDDFSFSASDGPPKPDRVFAAILRDGPAVGVHVVAWADTAASLQRCVDRGSMREFDLRALMQMSANDSSSLVDSPAASRLGPERALLFSEERGTLERFRPYEPPGPSELSSLGGGA